jgi:hypothetical protein
MYEDVKNLLLSSSLTPTYNSGAIESSSNTPTHFTVPEKIWRKKISNKNFFNTFLMKKRARLNQSSVNMNSGSNHCTSKKFTSGKIM